MMREGLRIGELASLLGTTTKTLRFYERIGLLRPAARSESGYRRFDQAATDRARLVIGLRRLDFSIEEVRAFLRTDSRMTVRQRLLGLMDEKLRSMYLQLGVLQGRTDDLAARHLALLAAPRDRPPDCICDAMFRACTCKTAPAGKPMPASRARSRNP